MFQEVSRKSKVDFKNGKVYVIRNSVNDLVYVGSTCQSLSQRMAQHRRDCNNKRHDAMKLYVLMKELGVDKFYIELLEYYPCNTREELYKREGECMRNQEPELNSKIQGRTNEEYRKEEREKVLTGKKEHYNKYKEHYKQQAIEYGKSNKEHVKIKKKEHYEKNRDKILEREKEKYNQNKDEINQRRRAKMKERKEEDEHFRQELNRKYREWYSKNKERQCQRRRELKQNQ